MKLTLKAARTNKGLSQEEAAKLIGVGTDTLGNYERGITYPDIPILKNIEKVYGVEYKDIIFLPWYYENIVIQSTIEGGRKINEYTRSG